VSYKENTLKLKKLLFKLKYLYAELDECNYTFDKCKENFSLEFKKKVSKLKKKEKNVIKKVDEQIKNSKLDNKKLDNDTSPKSFKNLYRKIAFETHPDKGHSKRRVRLFNKAKEAYSNGSWFNLVEIATMLEIPLPTPTKQQLESLSIEVNNVNGRISNIKNSVSWNWYFTDAGIKEKLMDDYIKSVLNN
jgi:hypothetical protein